MSPLPDLLQPRVEGQSLHGGGLVEKTGEGGQPVQIQQHQVVLLNVNIAVHCWQMQSVNHAVICASQNGLEHAHAFIHSPEACHFCDVEQNLNGKAK